MNTEKYEELMQVGRIYYEKGQAWLPSVKLLNTHEHHPAWTAALMFLILDRYVSTMDDQKQEEYIKAAMLYFEEMLKDGQNYLEELNFTDELE